MREIIITLLGVLFPLFIFSQNTFDPSIQSTIRILEIHQSSLSQLSPFDENEIEDIMRLNVKVIEELSSLLSKKITLDFPKDSIPFFTSESNDKNLANFSWEENMGGTYRPFINLFYWKNKNGNPRIFENNEEDAGFGTIKEIKNKEGETLYLLLGSGIGCTTCAFEKALLLKIGDNDLEEIFSYQIDYRFDSDINGFNFDDEKQILTYEFIEEDCEDDDGENCWVRGAFRFDGNTFVEIED